MISTRKIICRWRLGLAWTGAACWTGVVLAGMLILARHQMTPGQPAVASLEWPGRGILTLASDKPTLLMFVHPQCPCSAASMEELARLLVRCGDRVHTQVIVFHPADRPEDWSRTAIWRDAAAIPGVGVRLDPDALLARKFGARTSGQVFLYSGNGQLLFTGGITESRGHAGDNDGLDAILSILLQEIPAPKTPRTTPVFGCALYATANTFDHTTFPMFDEVRK